MRMLSEVDVVESIRVERRYQDKTHGSIEDAPHEAGTWILLIEAELAEANSALIKGGRGRDTWTNELIQVAALCCAAVEQHGFIDKEGRGV